MSLPVDYTATSISAVPEENNGKSQSFN